jgi:hypothetical protein
MYEIDYNIIMDKVSNKYHVDLLEIQRVLLITLFKAAQSSNTFVKSTNFEQFCEMTMLGSYLDLKYPKLGLYERAYSPWAQN